MRLCTFRDANGPRLGEVLGDRVQPLDGADVRDAIGGPVPAPVGDPVPLADLALLPPLRPGKVIGIGWNYPDHAREMGGRTLDAPVVFSKLATSITGPSDPVVRPALHAGARLRGRAGRGDRPARARRGARRRPGPRLRLRRDERRHGARPAAGRAAVGARQGRRRLRAVRAVGDDRATRCPTRRRCASAPGSTATCARTARTAGMAFTRRRPGHLVRGRVHARARRRDRDRHPARRGQGRAPPVFLAPGDVVRIEIAGARRDRERDPMTPEEALARVLAVTGLSLPRGVLGPETWALARALVARRRPGRADPALLAGAAAAAHWPELRGPDGGRAAAGGGRRGARGRRGVRDRPADGRPTRTPTPRSRGRWPCGPRPSSPSPTRGRRVGCAPPSRPSREGGAPRGGRRGHGRRRDRGRPARPRPRGLRRRDRRVRRGRAAGRRTSPSSPAAPATPRSAPGRARPSRAPTTPTRPRRRRACATSPRAIRRRTPPRTWCGCRPSWPSPRRRWSAPWPRRRPPPRPPARAEVPAHARPPGAGASRFGRSAASPKPARSMLR